MKIRSDLSSGLSYGDCAQQTNWWRLQAGLMRQFYENPQAQQPEGLWLPGQPLPRAGGYVRGEFFPDKSGYCSTV